MSRLAIGLVAEGVTDYVIIEAALSRFDLVIIHVDADVAGKRYSDIGVDPQDQVVPLPCELPCPPPEATADALGEVVLSWLGCGALGRKGLFCIPSKATEAWLAVAVASDLPRIMEGLECCLAMEDRLASLPKERRIRKSRRCYQEHADEVRDRWPLIAESCVLARRFQQGLAERFGSLADS